MSKPCIEKMVLENASAAMLLFDSALRLEYLNPAAEALFEVSARQVLGKGLDAILPHSEQVTLCSIQTVLAQGRTITERAVEVRINDGQPIKLDCTISPAHASGVVQGVLVELLRLDRFLRINHEDRSLAQISATQALIRGLAHEVKNPLGGLRGAAQLLEQELQEPELREYTQIIIEEADRLQDLVNRMLGPNRPSHYKPINIHQVLERVRTLVETEVNGQIQFVRDYDPSMPPVQGDNHQLIQAFLNIAVNAARAAGPKGRIVFRTRVERQFTIGNQRHKLAVRADIEDNGPGIPESIQDTLFFPLVSGSEGGTGLGLSIAQTLITQHRGLIAFRTRPGCTVFSVYLPLETAS